MSIDREIYATLERARDSLAGLKDGANDQLLNLFISELDSLLGTVNVEAIDLGARRLEIITALNEAKRKLAAQDAKIESAKGTEGKKLGGLQGYRTRLVNQVADLEAQLALYPE